jgi:hypothetical protein
MYKGIFVIMAFSIYSQCNHGKKKIDPYVIKIKDVSKPSKTTLKLNKDHWRWGMEVLENTLDDTSKIGIKPIPPNYIGKLFLTKCFIDSIEVHYLPYKAKKGTLVLRYFTSPY